MLLEPIEESKATFREGGKGRGGVLLEEVARDADIDSLSRELGLSHSVVLKADEVVV